MREVFKVKFCERIGPGFLTAVDSLHRKVGWNAEGFSWTHDPKHTLAMADGFDFNGKKQLEQTKWNVSVAPGSKLMGKGLRDGADSLDEQETQQYRSLVATALYVGQDKPETQYATKEAARFMSSPTRCEMYAQTFVQVLHQGTRAQLEFSISRNAKRDQGSDRCELGRGTGGAALDVVWMDLCW